MQQPRNGYSTGFDAGTVLKFQEFCLTDLDISRKTAQKYTGNLRKYLSANPFTIDAMRSFLAQLENPNTFNNYLKSFIAYAKYQDVKLPFKIKQVDPPIMSMPSRKELAEFYSALDEDYERLAFVGYAVTGLRRAELLGLKVSNVNTGLRMITPQHATRTKRSFMTFYNGEFEDLLGAWMKSKHKSENLFSIRGSDKSCLFVIAQKKTGLKITPKVLRFWFSNEMARLGVADRFIDAFQGRVPRSVLAKHYSDYSPENLKAIYDRAGLKVLT